MIDPDDMDDMRPECPMPPGPDLARLLEAAAGRLWGEKLPADSALQRMVAEVERLRGVVASAQTATDRLPVGEWEVWTSCSFRRISRVDGGDGDVLCGVKHRDGHPDLSWGEKECQALCDLVNGLRAALREGE
jgi:hypothetical protein